MDILELPSIPRERDKLRAVIGMARAAKRKRNLTIWSALNLAGWGLYVLLSSAQLPTPTHAEVPRNIELFLPTIMR